MSPENQGVFQLLKEVILHLLYHSSRNNTLETGVYLIAGQECKQSPIIFRKNSRMVLIFIRGSIYWPT
jgi:hypothetical protein